MRANNEAEREARIAAIEERVAKATVGPWAWATKNNDREQKEDSFYPEALVTAGSPYIDSYSKGVKILMGGGTVMDAEDGVLSLEVQDAAFIGNAREDIPFLLAELKAALAEVKALESEGDDG